MNNIFSSLNLDENGYQQVKGKENNQGPDADKKPGAAVVEDSQSDEEIVSSSNLQNAGVKKQKSARKKK